MKREVATIDASPSKRLFLSIIADYDLNRSVCELVDNALDAWVRHNRDQAIDIRIVLDERQQTITVEDNAGGLAREELRYIVGPGQTGTSPSDETIGIFGVGTKRAVVALSQDVRIRTRRLAETTFQLEFDDAWLEDDSWELPIFEVDDILEGTTILELQRLRILVTQEAIESLKEYLCTTYARFLANNQAVISVNDDRISPRFFENWAYPPKFCPRRYVGTLNTQDNQIVRVEALAGLTRESSPAAGEYGVYFYCNDRLVARALKSFEVGFTKGIAGLPHPKVSLTRVLVFLNGDARSMPWNSSKSDLNTRHEVFIALHNWLIQVVKDYASLSRIWMGDWAEKVFKYTVGSIEEVRVDDFPSVRKSYLPPMPKSKPRYGELITARNKDVAVRKPWTIGLYEGVIAADLISRQRLEQRNRIALIVLDSTLEIAFKEYLVNESGTSYGERQLLDIFSNRSSVHSEVKKHVKIKAATWKKIDHYYRLRCKLIHERATVGIDDRQLADFRRIVEDVLTKLYKLEFRAR